MRASSGLSRDFAPIPPGQVARVDRRRTGPATAIAALISCGFIALAPCWYLLVGDLTTTPTTCETRLVIYLVEIMATVGLKPRFDTRRASFTMLILEKSGRLVMVFPRQSPRKAMATSSSDSRFRAAA